MKTWEKPKLIVLVRNKPEEAVLDVCKHAVGSGAFNMNNGCLSQQDAPGSCAFKCDGYISS